MRTTAALLLGLTLAACASAEQPLSEPASAPPPAAVSIPAQATAPGTSVAAPDVVPPPAPRPRVSNDEDVVIAGRQRQQVPAPADPRTTQQRMADIRSWDTCVLRLQGRAESATEPQMDSPEEVCRRTLGMANRNAVPISRRP